MIKFTMIRVLWYDVVRKVNKLPKLKCVHLQAIVVWMKYVLRRIIGPGKVYVSVREIT